MCECNQRTILSFVDFVLSCLSFVKRYRYAGLCGARAINRAGMTTGQFVGLVVNPRFQGAVQVFHGGPFCRSRGPTPAWGPGGGDVVQGAEMRGIKLGVWKASRCGGYGRQRGFIVTEVGATRTAGA